MCQTGSLVNNTNNNENKVFVSVLFFLICSTFIGFKY